MNYFDYYDFNQLLVSPFIETERLPSWKKTTSSHFDGFLTQFDEVMAKYHPSSGETKIGLTGSSSDRATMMSFLVDKIRAEGELLKRQLMGARSRNEADNKSFEVQLKALTIALRMRNGDDVSADDLRFLEANDPELFEHAMELIQQKKSG